VRVRRSRIAHGTVDGGRLAMDVVQHVARACAAATTNLPHAPAGLSVGYLVVGYS
jgi:xanthine/CO dehydrogenase XdhC/CoxF family maturation factor